MRIYQIKRFHQFAVKNHISDQTLLEAVFNAEQGLIAANLGGGVIKQRFPKQGQGKSGGYRTILYYKRGDLAIFAYGFEKNDLDNIDHDELTFFKATAKKYLSYTSAQLDELVRHGTIIPIALNS